MKKVSADIQKELLRLSDAMEKVIQGVKEQKEAGNIKEAKYLIKVYKEIELRYNELYTRKKELIVENTYITDIPYFRNEEVTAIPIEVFDALPNLIPGFESIIYQDLIMGFGHEFSVSFEELATRWGVSYPTAFKYVHNLEELGLIEIKTGKGKGVKNRYKMKYIYVTDDIKKFKIK